MTMMYSPTTITLRDALRYETDLLDDLELSTDARTISFKNMFIAMYNNRSLGAETISLFKYWITDKFNEVKDYYEQRLDIYEKELDGDDGKTITRTLSEDNSSTVNNGSHTDSSNTGTHYDLPRTSSATASPTTQDTETNELNGNSTSSGVGNRDLTETITGDVNIIEQREKWLKFIRNIYHDMCKEFKDCFSLIYS